MKLICNFTTAPSFHTVSRCSRRAAVRWRGAEAPRALQAFACHVCWHVEAARGRANDPLGARDRTSKIRHVNCAKITFVSFLAVLGAIMLVACQRPPDGHTATSELQAYLDSDFLGGALKHDFNISKVEKINA